LAADQQQSHDQNQAAPVSGSTSHDGILAPEGIRVKRENGANISVENPKG
jgi:hypothetical protein